MATSKDAHAACMLAGYQPARGPLTAEQHAALAAEAAEAAINAGAKHVQNALGITSGDVAGLFFCDPGDLRLRFARYIAAELRTHAAHAVPGIYEAKEEPGTLDDDTGGPILRPRHLLTEGNAYWLENEGGFTQCLMTAPRASIDGGVIWSDDAEVEPEACDDYAEIVAKLKA